MDKQQHLPGVSNRRAARIDDFVDLFPPGVMPMGKLNILQQGTGLLIVKSYEHDQKVMPKHKFIFKQLVACGEAEGSPSAITVVCVWGLGPTTRRYQVFDHRGEQPVKATDITGWRSFVKDWFREQRS